MPIKITPGTFSATKTPTADITSSSNKYNCLQDIINDLETLAADIAKVKDGFAKNMLQKEYDKISAEYQEHFKEIVKIPFKKPLVEVIIDDKHIHGEPQAEAIFELGRIYPVTFIQRPPTTHLIGTASVGNTHVKFDLVTTANIYYLPRDCQELKDFVANEVFNGRSVK